MTQWTLEGDIAMQNLDVVRGSNRIAMIDCENEALCDFDIMTNARLIAAAPDLLAVLQEAVNKGYMWDHDPELWSKANAAIAKAKGE